MYERLTTKTGAGAVQQYITTFDIQPGADGVVFAPPDANAFYADVSIPDRLRTFLFDLRLLRHIPIAYYVPDAALLPPESIRFFHVDPTWMDRVIDGVFSAANTGTVDSMFSASMLAMVRTAIDADLADHAEKINPGSGWTPAQGMTGMLIRSELVRRWPDMIVRAFKTLVDDVTPDPAHPNVPPQLPVLRLEPISKDILIAIFGGTPATVHVREPHVGVRFGVEENPPGSTVWIVPKRDTDGNPILKPDHNPDNWTVTARNAQKRTLNITNLAAGVGNSARMVALQLERRPYVQEFKNNAPETRGSVPFSNFVNADGSLKIVNLRYGRTMNLKPLQARLAQLQQMYPKEKP